MINDDPLAWMPRRRTLREWVGAMVRSGRRLPC